MWRSGGAQAPALTALTLRAARWWLPCRLDSAGGVSLGGTDDPVIVSLLRWWDGFRGSFQRDGPTADDLELLSVVPPGVHLAVSTLGRHEFGTFRIAAPLLGSDAAGDRGSGDSPLGLAAAGCAPVTLHALK